MDWMRLGGVAVSQTSISTLSVFFSSSPNTTEPVWPLTLNMMLFSTA